MSDFPRLLYRDGDLSLDFVEVESPEQEAQANAEGFFFHVTHRTETHVDGLQIPEVEETAEAEVTADPDDDRAALRAAYLEKFGENAPGRMSTEKLRAALESEA